MHRAIDPLLPRAGVEQRVIQEAHGRINTEPRRSSRWGWPLRTTLGGGLVALAVVALIGGVLGITLSLRSHAHESTGFSGPPLPPTKPPVTSTTPPTHWATPSTVSYVAPASVSFPTPSDGWAVGDACDSQRRCEVGVARSTDGGATWALVSSPVSPEATSYGLRVVASSSVDAWVWGSDSTGLAAFASTHNGGQSWEQLGLSGGVVLDVAIADGTTWAEIGCVPGSSSCTSRLLSSPVHGGPWSDLGPLPAAVQGAPFSNSAVSGPQIVRSMRLVWVLNANQQRPGLVRSDDGGRSWVSLPLPCVYGARMILGASSANHVMLACANIGGWPAPQEVWSSSDGGAHWILRSRQGFAQSSPPAFDVGTISNGGAPIGLVVLSNSTAWMANEREDNLVTHDDGVTWTHAALPQNYFGGAGGAEGVTFADALHGWTFVSAGVWATSDGGDHWRYQPIIGPVPGY
jgi:hypothetical protein